MKEEESQVLPLRTILKNFLNLVKNIDNRRDDEIDFFDKEFLELKKFSEDLKNDPNYLCKEGEKVVNRKKNRYKDILPFDYSRVTLKDNFDGDIPGCDYINANYIKGASGSSAYIACQGPLSHTLNEFWRMIVECEVQVIIMACNEKEGGKHKCESYWADEINSEKQFGQVVVWHKKCRNVCPDFLVRTMRIKYQNAKGEYEERNVCQFHYSAWPDHDVPKKVSPLLDMVRLIRDCQISETLPVLIHCSAGCGRTGTICAIDFVWGLLRLGKLSSDFSLFNLVKEMRRQRIAMVQTKDQYILVHRAVKELFEEQLKLIDSHHYANIDINGLPFEIREELEEPTYEAIEFCTTISKEDIKPVKRKVEEKILKSSPPIDNIHSEDDAAYSQQQQQQIEQDVNKNIQEKRIENKYEVFDADKGQQQMDLGFKAGGLLRKSSLNKLKSFFDKSSTTTKEEKLKKISGSNLNRTKSDASSSRFYNNFSFRSGSKFNANNSSSSSNNIEDAFPSSSNNIFSSKNIEKPPIRPKPPAPLKPIKRSKSLKINFGGKDKGISNTENNKSKNIKNTKNLDNLTTLASRLSSTSTSSSNSNTSSSISLKSPIVISNIQSSKEIDIPKLQKIETKSVKPELKTATTTLFFEKSCENKKESTSLFKASESSESLEKDENEKETWKSTSPFQISLNSMDKNDNSKYHNYVNVSYRKDNLKVGNAKELEDIDKYKSSSTSLHHKKLRKYDTLNPKTMSSYFSQNEKSFNTIDEAIQSNKNRKVFDTDENLKSIDFHQSDKVDSGEQYIGSNKQRLKPKDLFIQVQEKSKIKSPYSSNIPYQYQDSYLGDRTRIETMPLLKCRQGYSSESSTTTTPRDSLPGTPTQTFDVLCSQLSKNNDNIIDSSSNANNDKNSCEYGASLQLQQNNTTGNNSYSNFISGPKSILKGSLSSTPSDSDEKLNSTRLNTYLPPLPIPTSSSLILNSPSKINHIRALGIRERRNSFRKAVCKDQDVAAPPAPPTLFENHSPQLYNSNSSPISRDYEHIWPSNSKKSGNVNSSSSTLMQQEDDLFDVKVNHKRNQIPMRSQTFNFSNNSSNNKSLFNERNDDHRNQANYLRNDPSFKNRVDEIKVLLQELDAPIQQKTHLENFSKNSLNLKLAGNNSGSGGALKYNRSLRVLPPTRSQVSSSSNTPTSCFTLKKPASIESIMEQLNIENAQYQKGRGGGYIPYDHVALGPRSEENPNKVLEVSNNNNTTSNISKHQVANFESKMPIPPPRTKRGLLQLKDSKKFDSINKSNISTTPGGGAGANDDIIGNNELQSPSKINYSRNKQLDNHQLFFGNSSMNPAEVKCSANSTLIPTSPKVITRALGMFQAKAANVRTKFANWTESKEKSLKSKDGNSSPSTSTSSFYREPNPNEDGGFESASSAKKPTALLSSRSHSKHVQYL